MMFKHEALTIALIVKFPIEMQIIADNVVYDILSFIPTAGLLVQPPNSVLEYKAKLSERR